jgi:hypothetical protein
MKKIKSFFLVYFSVLTFMTGLAYAGPASVINYTVDLFNGDVKVSHDAGTNWQEVEIDMVLSESNWLSTAADSECELTLSGNQGTMRVLDNSLIILSQMGKQTRIHVTQGHALFDISRKLKSDENFEVETSASTAAVRGTQFFIEGDQETGKCSVISGTVGVRRRLDVGGDENFRRQAERQTEVLATKDREIDLNRSDNRRLEGLIRENRGNPEKLREIYRQDRQENQKRLGPIRNRDYINRAFARHRSERLKIQQSRAQKLKNKINNNTQNKINNKTGSKSSNKALRKNNYGKGGQVKKTEKEQE